MINNPASEYYRLKKLDVRVASQMPLCKHWVILVSGSLTVKTYDDRYGDSTTSQSIVEYHAFLSEKDWKHGINLLVQEGKREFRVMVANPAQLEISARVTTE